MNGPCGFGGAVNGPCGLGGAVNVSELHVNSTHVLGPLDRNDAITHSGSLTLTLTITLTLTLTLTQFVTLNAKPPHNTVS